MVEIIEHDSSENVLVLIFKQLIGLYDPCSLEDSLHRVTLQYIYSKVRAQVLQ